MNRKGQTLILFILLLPVLLLLLSFLINLGTLQIQKRKLDNTINQALTYGMEHKINQNLEYDIYRLLLLNLKDVQNHRIQIEEDYITIEVTKRVETIFPFSTQQITITKRIYQEDDSYKIIKE